MYKGHFELGLKWGRRKLKAKDSLKKKKQVLGHALECSKIRWTIQIIFHHSDSVGVKWSKLIIKMHFVKIMIFAQ